MTSVGLDLLWLRPGVVGGTETYATRLIAALLEHAPELELHSFAPSDAIEAHPCTLGATTTHALGRSVPPARRIARERTVLRRTIQTVDPDVVHHLGGGHPPHEAASVVTIHDLQPIEQPNTFSRRKVAWLARAIPRAIERASVVCCPSDWVAHRIGVHFDVDPDRIRSVPMYVPEPAAQPEKLPVSILELAARGPLAFYPAMTLSHKNHRTLFAAFARAKEIRRDLQLVCCGAIGADHDELVALAARLSTDIHMLGRVDSAELAALYRLAERVVFPSTYEGFGLPVIEAQQAGVPLAVARAAALPEVAGAGANYVDPHDVNAWADLLASEPGAEEVRVVELGRRNAARFSAASSAAAQVEAYRSALDV